MQQQIEMERRGNTDRIPGQTPLDRMGRGKSSSIEHFYKQPKKFIDNRVGISASRLNDQSAQSTMRMERFLQNARVTGQSSEFESSKKNSRRRKNEKSSPTRMSSDSNTEKRDY